MCNMLEKERKSATRPAPPGFTLKEFKQLFARGLRPLLTGTGHDWGSSVGRDIQGQAYPSPNVENRTGIIVWASLCKAV